MAVYEFTPAEEAPDNQPIFRGSQILSHAHNDPDYGMYELMESRMQIFRESELPNTPTSDFIGVIAEVHDDLKKIKDTAQMMDAWPDDEVISWPQKRGAFLPVDLCERFIDDDKDVIIHHVTGLAMSVPTATEAEIIIKPIESEIEQWHFDDDLVSKLVLQALTHAKNIGATLVAEQIQPQRNVADGYDTHISVGIGEYDPSVVGNNYKPLFTINLDLVDNLAKR
jgi:hypothetical protein